MDGSRFDDLTRALGATRSRRSLLGALAGAALASIGLGEPVSANSARNCRAVGNACNGNGNCCSHNCVKESRTRKICHCQSAADCPASTNPCVSPVCGDDGYCRTTINEGRACDDGNACTHNDACQADGSCAGVAEPCSPPPSDCFDIGVCDPSSGNCSAPSYRGDGASCGGGGICAQGGLCCIPDDIAVTCANGKCGPQTNNCGRTVQCPRLSGEACGQDSDCCSDVCIDAKCQGGPVGVNAACDSPSDCLSGACCSDHCADLDSDPANCGGCGQVCSNANIPAPACSGGVCNGACATGYGDCDANKLTNGCETNLLTDHAHCGACGHACSADETCCAGACVDLETSQDNCGACGRACTGTGELCYSRACACSPEDPSVTCAGGACGLKNNNCGAPVQCLLLADETCAQDDDCCSGACVDGRCQAGPVAAGDPCDSNGDCASHACCDDSICRDLDGDRENCGGCGQVCSFNNMATRTCAGGSCDGECAPGFADCDNDKLTNGCETNLQIDPNHCGACGHACSSTQYCSSGTCVELGDTGQACGTDGQCLSGHCCGGLCADTQNDASNCGTCGAICSIPNATAMCEYGECVVKQCDPGFKSCGGLCNANLDTDANNCGACGVVCPRGQTCGGGGAPGVCGSPCGSCPTGQVCHNATCCTPNCLDSYPGCGGDDGCGGTCGCPECTVCVYDFQSDRHLCSSASTFGQPCTGEDLCHTGTCGSNGQCAVTHTNDCGFDPCHACNPDTGQCEPLADDTACDLDCHAGATCQSGICTGGSPVADGTGCGGGFVGYADLCGSCHAGACLPFADGVNCDTPQNAQCNYNACVGGVCVANAGGPRPDFSMTCDSALGGASSEIPNQYCVQGACLVCDDGPAGGFEACSRYCGGYAFCDDLATCCPNGFGYACCAAGTTCNQSTGQCLDSPS